MNVKPTYYVRMRVNGEWYVLWRVRHNKTSQKMEPIWWKESELGDSFPYVYRTQTRARQAVESYGSANRETEIAVWSNDAELQTSSPPTT